MKVDDEIASRDDFLEWDQLAALFALRRAKEAMRLAMGIGDDSQLEMLQAFVNDPQIPVIRAQDAYGITKFFRWVTMSVSVRAVGRNPNSSRPATLEGFDDGEFVL